ncbi:uncharacterized protein LOC127853261 isoform X2 [Dreissena polymorpha]|uniref:uncharacterized protein LOC127853261 isoform X2 n=1 Tax=Dreissena polymorpha TaxID=45954 RepID=UPI002264C112|nr:uncharacterized protein LOC127853261 isoform X2 [Dreissena polymorpha]
MSKRRYTRLALEKYTAVIKLPDMECDHCVIRARYDAHKPGEDPFLQCADIKISKGAKKSDTLNYLSAESKTDQQKLVPLKKALKLKKYYDQKYKSNLKMQDTKLYGFAYNPFQPHSSHYISVSVVTGATQMLNGFAFGIDDPSGGKDSTFMADEVVAIDNGRNTTTILVHDVASSREVAAKIVYSIGSQNGSHVQTSDIFQYDGVPINGLSWYTDKLYAAFRIVPYNNDFFFEVGTLDIGGLYTKRASIPTAEDLYVNFQWLETDMNSYKHVFALMGNENDPIGLSARIYMFDLFNGQFIQAAEVDVREYTFMSMHSYQNGGEAMYAFSPGLWSDSGHDMWAWSLVAVDTMNGAVTKQCDIAPRGIFQRYYGGSVFQGSSNPDGFLYHVLRVMYSEADFIVGVNPDTCEVRFSEVTNLRYVHSLQLVNPAP